LSITQDNLYKKIYSVTLCKFWHRAYTFKAPQHIQNPAHDHVWILQKHRSRYFTFQFFKQKLKLKSIYMLRESCISCHTEHNKIEFAIFGFLCDFIWILQVAAKNTQRGKNHFAHRPSKRLKSSQICPRFAQNSLEVSVALQCSPRGKVRRGSPDSSEAGCRAGRGSVWEGSRGYRGPVWVLTRGKEVVGGHGRRSRAAGAAESSTPASWLLGLGNKWTGQLRWVLMKVPRGLGRGETERARELHIDDNGASGGSGAACARCGAYCLL
jgi:hypothetical protein